MRLCPAALASLVALWSAAAAQAGWTGCQMGLNGNLAANEAATSKAPDAFKVVTTKLPGGSGGGYGGGGEIGCDLDMGGFVLGLGANYDFLAVNSKSTKTSHYKDFESKVDDTMTVEDKARAVMAGTARIGAPVGSFLFFLRGGVAFARTNESYEFTRLIDRYNQSSVTDLTGKTSRHGYVVGGGVEMEVRPAFSVKLEYSRYELGTCDCSLTGSKTINSSMIPAPITTSAKGVLHNKLAIDLVKIGAFYRF